MRKFAYYNTASSTNIIIMEYCLVYFSTSVGLLSDEDLLTILRQSQRNNAQMGITGVLLYVRGSIVQVLEGDRQALEALYERIVADQRHHNVTKVISRPIQERLFGEWRMGYETLTTRQLAQLRDIVQLDTNSELPTETNEPAILKMIKLFYDSNRYN